MNHARLSARFLGFRQKSPLPLRTKSTFEGEGIMNFRSKLLSGLIPLLILSVGAVAAVSYWYASDAVLSRQELLMRQLVDKTLNEMTRWLEGRESQAKVFAETGVFIAACQGQRKEEAQARLETYHKTEKVYENIFLATPEGKLFMDSIGGKSIGVDITQIPIYAINAQKAKEGKIWVGQVAASPVDGQPVVLVTAPIKNKEGKLVGIVGTPIELNSFSKEAIGDTRIGESGYMYMVDDRGVVLGHPDGKLILKTDISEYDWGKTILAMKNGQHFYDWQGEERVVYFATDPKTGWLVGAASKVSDFMSQVHKIGWTSLIVGVIAVFLGVLVIWLITSKVFKVIRESVVNLNGAGEQLDGAAFQVSSSSQSLAEGSSEQAASLEETSSSLEEISSMTRQNADNAQQANQLMTQAGQLMDNANSSMDELSQAMAPNNLGQ